jgi:hypothetical protein
VLEKGGLDKYPHPHVLLWTAQHLLDFATISQPPFHVLPPRSSSLYQQQSYFQEFAVFAYLYTIEHSAVGHHNMHLSPVILQLLECGVPSPSCVIQHQHGEQTINMLSRKKS